MDQDGGKKGGCTGCVLGLLSALSWWVLVGSLGFIVLLVHSEPELGHIDGFGEIATSGEVRETARLLAGARMGGETVVTEESLNRYLAATVIGSQTEQVSEWVRFEAVAVDLKDGACEVYLVRNFLKRRSVVSIRLGLEEEDETRFFPFRGGRAGALPLVGGLGMIGGDAYWKLHQVLKKEVDAVLGCRNVEFVEGALTMRGYADE